MPNISSRTNVDPFQAPSKTLIGIATVSVLLQSVKVKKALAMPLLTIPYHQLVRSQAITRPSIV